MVKTWVMFHFKEDFIIVVWDAKTNLQNLKELGLIIFENEMYEAELLVLQAISVEDLVELSQRIQDLKDVPYYQVWALGTLLFDSIDVGRFEDPAPI